MTQAIDYTEKMKTWSFVRETETKVYSISGLNYSSVGTLERIFKMEVGEIIDIYGNKLKRVR